MAVVEEKRPVGLARAGIIFGTTLTVMVQAVDITIAAVALPHMQGSLSASQDEINWVITSYIVAVAIMTGPCGWLANRYGRKRILMIGVVGFTVASVLTGFSQTLDEVVLARFLQGAFGALLVPLSQSLLLDTFDPKDGVKAMAWWNLGGTLGPILGPNLGGWITQNWDWRWVFFINIPIGILCFVSLGLLVPETKKTRIGFDWFGFVAFSIFIGACQLVLDRGSGQDWFGSTEIIAEAAVAVLCLYIFCVHSMTATKPFIDFGNLRDWNFACGTAFSFAFNGLFLTSLVLIPAFLQNVAGEPASLAGYLMVPRSIGTSIVVVLIGRLGSRFDLRGMTLFGLLIGSYMLYQMSQWTLDVSAFEVSYNGFFQGISTGIAFVSMQTLTFSGIAPARRNGAVSVYALGRTFGQSIGVSAVTVLLVRNAQISHADLAAKVTPFNRALRSGAAQHFWNLNHTGTLAALDAEIGRQAALIAYLDDFKLLLFLSLTGLPLVLLLRRPKPPRVPVGG